MIGKGKKCRKKREKLCLKFFFYHFLCAKTERNRIKVTKINVPMQIEENLLVQLRCVVGGAKKHDKKRLNGMVL